MGYQLVLGVRLRRWQRNPMLAAHLFATIAVGMAAATAVLSVLLAIAFQPLPFRDSARVVQLWNRVELGAAAYEFSGAEVVGIQESTHDLFEELGAFYVFPFWMMEEGKGPEPLNVARLEVAAFQALEVKPVVGRPVNPAISVAVGDSLGPVWISSRLWHSRFGGRESVVGETIRLAQNEAGLYESRAQVVGVMPPDIRLPHPRLDGSVDVWAILPLALTRQAAKAEVFFALGRLKGEVTVEQAQAQLSALADRRTREEERRRRPTVQSLDEIVLGPVRQTAGVVSVGVVFVLILAFASVASLMVVEGRRRRLELAVRTALGASRWQLWKELVADQAVLALAALALGLPLAWLGLRGLTNLLVIADLGRPLASSPKLDLSVMAAFTCCVLGAAIGWAALIVRGLGAGTIAVIRGDSTGSTAADLPVAFLRFAILSVQVCLGVVLMVLAASATTTYLRLTEMNLGPAPDRTAFFTVRRSTGEAPTSAQSADFNVQVRSRVQRLPGVEASGFVDVFPPLGAPAPFWKPDDVAESPRQTTLPLFVSHDYFGTLGIPILFGRGFSDSDRFGGHPVAIIDLEMARRNWRSPADAVNAQIQLRSRTARYEVIGVAGSFGGYWARTPVPTVYLSQTQYPSNGGVAIVRLEPDSSISTSIAQAQGLLREMPVRPIVSAATTLEAEWQATSTRPRARMFGVLALGAIGLLLGVQGVYALAASLLASRNSELAIRAALGARRGALIWGVLRQVAVSVAIGSGAGVVAIMTVRRLAPPWIGLSISDPATSIGVAVGVLACSAFLGAYVPARRATRPTSLLPRFGAERQRL